MTVYIPDDYPICNYRYPLYYTLILINIYIYFIIKKYIPILLFITFYMALIIYIDNKENYIVINDGTYNILYKKYYTIYKCFE